MASYTQGTNSNLTKKMWDKVLHEQVQDKSFFKGLIGKDKGGEGSIEESISNFPIVEKTQLGKDSGDAITIGLVKQLTQGDTSNAGKVGNQELVGSESSMTFHYVKAVIDHYRNGVLIEGKMTEQRSPFDLQKIASQLLSTHLAKQLDDSIFFSIYYGYSPNVIRTGAGTASSPKNFILGNGTAITDTVANNTVPASPAGTSLTASSLDLLATVCAEGNLSPIMVDGEPRFLLIAHPRSIKTLRADSAWINAQQYANLRGAKNPLFAGSVGMWNGIVVKESNKISTLKIPTSLTVASNAITAYGDDVFNADTSEASYRMNILLGANAVARAYGVESYMARRKEDDYGNRIGFGGGYIYGDRRADFTEVVDAGNGTTTKNQSSIVVANYSPAVASGVTIW